MAVLVNGLGATPLEELYLLYRRTHQRLEELGVVIERRYIGEYATSLEMAGGSISLLKVDDELLELASTADRSVLEALRRKYFVEIDRLLGVMERLRDPDGGWRFVTGNEIILLVTRFVLEVTPIGTFGLIAALWGISMLSVDTAQPLTTLAEVGRLALPVDGAAEIDPAIVTERWPRGLPDSDRSFSQPGRRGPRSATP